MFDGGLLNRPEFTMSGILSTSGRVEITIFAGPSCIVLIGELKYQFKEQDSSDILAQMLCEADGIRVSEHWLTLRSRLLEFQSGTWSHSNLLFARRQ